MLSLPKDSALALAVLAATALPAGAAVEVSSATHPLLRRALAERPESDRDGNGVLSLEEYRALQPKPPGHQPIQDGKLPFLPVLPGGEVLIADFEDNKYRNAPGWTNEGSAFTGDLNAGTNMMKRRVGPFHGKFFLTSFTKSDAETGRLLSPEFALEMDYLVLTMSGGNFPQRVGANLWIGEELVRTATGKNDDFLEEVALDVREYRGRLARLELLDRHPGLWGHLNLDRIVMKSGPGQARVIDSRPPPLISPDGLALTTDGLVRGPLGVQGGQLVGATKPLPPDTLILALNPREPRPEGQSGALRLIDREVWHGEIRNLEGSELTINTSLFGERKVPLQRIASIEFRASPPGARRQPGHLYRAGGEPIPGKLLWVRQKDIAIDCALGVIPIPRESVERFVLAEAQPTPPGKDTIGLMDGGLLFGKTRFDGNQLVVEHQILGELRLDWQAVRSLRRHLAGVDWLEKLPMTVIERVGPALPPPGPRWHESRDHSHLRAIRVMPHTEVRFTLGTGPNRRSLFRTELATVPGCRADLKVSVLADEATLWQQRVTAGSDPIPLSLELSSAEELTIEVEFDGPLAFPCGIDLRDPHLLNLAQIQSQSQTKQPN